VFASFAFAPSDHVGSERGLNLCRVRGFFPYSYLSTVSVPDAAHLLDQREAQAQRLEDSNRSRTSMPILSLQNVAKEYAADGQVVRALEGITLDAAAGEFVALVGRSGCGKSTLLNLAGAMDFPSSVSVHIDGVPTSSLDDAGLTELRRDKVGFVFQSFQLLHTLTVYENVELPLLLSGMAGARATVDERLRWVELDGLGHRYPHQLSGGQMQRVAIARALVHSPKLLLADEPTGNLDTATGSLILNLLQRLTREQKTATLLATHSQEAAGISDTFVRLRDGRIETIERH
jgi:putative ABC transport system ATP-binding protein